MKNFINKLALNMILLSGLLMNAQTPPPPPINPESGDIGGISQPIDMYTIWLALSAVSLIIYFVRKQQKKIA